MMRKKNEIRQKSQIELTDDFSVKLQYFMTKYNITASVIYERIGTDYKTISRYKNGQSEPKLTFIVEFYKYLKSIIEKEKEANMFFKDEDDITLEFLLGIRKTVLPQNEHYAQKIGINDLSAFAIKGIYENEDNQYGKGQGSRKPIDYFNVLIASDCFNDFFKAIMLYCDRRTKIDKGNNTASKAEAKEFEDYKLEKAARTLAHDFVDRVYFNVVGLKKSLLKPDIWIDPNNENE